MIRAVLIDDEPKNTAVLEQMLTDYCPQVIVAGKADNSLQALELIRQVQPDLVFLDIEMPYGNAFDLLDKLKPVDFEIIFVTAFDNYMLKAFKYSALDYLLKPVDIDELIAAVERVEKRNQSRQQIDFQQLEILMCSLKTARLMTEKIALPADTGLVFVDVAEIMRFEAQRGYTAVYLENGQKILSTRNIKDYEEMLPDSLFFRIHNSHLVNLNFVRKYQKGRGGYIELNDGTSLEVATRRKDELLARFGHKNL